MTCDEFQSHTAALALGVATAEVRRAGQRHLADEGDRGPCAAHLERARRLVAQLGLALPPVRPSEQAWRRLEALVGTAAPARGFRGRALLAWLLPAILSGLLWWQRQRADAAVARSTSCIASAQQRSGVQRRAWQQLAQGTARVVRVQAQGDGGHVLAVVEPSTRRAWLWATGLPSGQRWSVRGVLDGPSQPLGDVTVDVDGELLAELAWPAQVGAVAQGTGEAVWLSAAASGD